LRTYDLRNAEDEDGDRVGFQFRVVSGGLRQRNRKGSPGVVGGSAEWWHPLAARFFVYRKLLFKPLLRNIHERSESGNKNDSFQG
jgi:hypothetical protein